MDNNFEYKPDAFFDSTSEVVNKCFEIFMGISVVVIFCVFLHYLCRLVFFDWCNDNQDTPQFQTVINTPLINSSNLFQRLFLLPKLNMDFFLLSSECSGFFFRGEMYDVSSFSESYVEYVAQ